MAATAPLARIAPGWPSSPAPRSKLELRKTSSPPADTVKNQALSSISSNVRGATRLTPKERLNDVSHATRTPENEIFGGKEGSRILAFTANHENAEYPSSTSAVPLLPTRSVRRRPLGSSELEDTSAKYCEVAGLGRQQQSDEIKEDHTHATGAPANGAQAVSITSPQGIGNPRFRSLPRSPRETRLRVTVPISVTAPANTESDPMKIGSNTRNAITEASLRSRHTKDLTDIRGWKPLGVMDDKDSNMERPLSNNLSYIHRGDTPDHFTSNSKTTISDHPTADESEIAFTRSPPDSIATVTPSRPRDIMRSINMQTSPSVLESRLPDTTSHYRLRSSEEFHARHHSQFSMASSVYSNALKFDDEAPLVPPSLRIVHYDCYQGHRSIKVSNNMFSPVPCMVCGIKDNQLRWKCTFCCLRICGSCVDVLSEDPFRDLRKLEEYVAQAGMNHDKVNGVDYANETGAA
ncbi:hypothetical protein MMC25_008104 [Agyrium rufum]|nr:hypothetical protein [Agyrium rufum]